MTRLPSFPQAHDKEKSGGFLFELIAMIDILFTCNPSVAEREWISCQLFPLSTLSPPVCSFLRLPAKTANTQTISRTYSLLNTCTSTEIFALLVREPAASPALIRDGSATTPDTRPSWGRQTRLVAPKLPGLSWRTVKLTTDYCEL